MNSVNVPFIHAGIAGVQVIALLKQPGEPVLCQEFLCEIAVGKTVIEIKSPVSRTFGQWHVGEWDRVPEGSALAAIVTANYRG